MYIVIFYDQLFLFCGLAAVVIAMTNIKRQNIAASIQEKDHPPPPPPHVATSSLPSQPTIVLQYMRHEFTTLQRWSKGALRYNVPYICIIKRTAVSHLLQLRLMHEQSLLWILVIDCSISRMLIKDISHWLPVSEWVGFHLKADTIRSLGQQYMCTFNKEDRLERT